MARIEDRVTPNAQYADQQHKRMQESKELRAQDRARSERIHEQALETERREQVQTKERVAREHKEELRSDRQSGKGANLDKMA